MESNGSAAADYTLHACKECGGPVVIDNDEPTAPKHIISATPTEEGYLVTDCDRDHHHEPIV